MNYVLRINYHLVTAKKCEVGYLSLQIHTNNKSITNNMANNVIAKDIISQIFYIRGYKVMLDFHLSVLYCVETRALKQQVKRNLNRFPGDFMFQLSEMEWQELITNCDKLGSFKFSPATPYAFTEQGVAMLSGILRSERAVRVNIAIMRAFVQMRELINENKALKQKLDEIEEKYDSKFQIVFEAIKQLIEQKNVPRKPIGFKAKKN